MSGIVLFERENAKSRTNPTAALIDSELKKLRSTGPSSYASVTNESGDYLQVAGGLGGMLLEKRDASSGRRYRAFQAHPVVPFPDGTELVFTAGRMALQAREWFALRQIVEVFTAFVAGEPVPSYVCWRDISSVLGSIGTH